jgi:D-sedoheptulose 7-phosphate isomerase|tara:strand:- start:2511 stop:3092 length:582 start_codon:yes stop_codon:yes gene_type:complete
LSIKLEIHNKILDSSESIKKSIENIPEIIRIIESITKSLKKGNKIILFGNGGSAADAQHIAAELVGRFDYDRKSLPAISLTTDTSVITSIGNDYSFEKIFSRQCESLVNKGDVVVGISTSGNSINVKNGLLVSKRKGAKTVGFLGHKGGHIKNIVDIPLIVNSNSTPRIQEVHRTAAHIICEMVEKNISRRSR